jgi:hypothetical protein
MELQTPVVVAVVVLILLTEEQGALVLLSFVMLAHKGVPVVPLLQLADIQSILLQHQERLLHDY